MNNIYYGNSDELNCPARIKFCSSVETIPRGQKKQTQLKLKKIQKNYAEKKKNLVSQGAMHNRNKKTNAQGTEDEAVMV